MTAPKTTIVRKTGTHDSVRGPQLQLFPRRVALVARDRRGTLRQKDLDTKKSALRRSRWGLGPHLPDILARCSAEGCDTILFSLWTTKTVTHEALFPPSTTHNAVILSVRSKSKEIVEVWVRNNSVPIQVEQLFGKSSDARDRKEAFVQQLRSRVWGDSALVICGESNILKVPRGSRSAIDPYRVRAILDQTGVRIVLNPIHTYMRRFEMPVKRIGLARNGLIVSLWNRGFVRGSESQVPWQVFRGRKDISGQVDDISKRGVLRPGVRIGILDVR